jgi:peptidyl-dipeptidase A
MVGTMRAPAPVLVAVFALACGGSNPTPTSPADGPEAAAQRFLAEYQPRYVELRTAAAEASWIASTDVSDAHTEARTQADLAMSEFTGSAEVIRTARGLLSDEDALEPMTVRMLRAVLESAAYAPMSAPELARRRIEAESQQSARLDGFQFCMAREGDACTQPVTTNDIDRILFESRDLAERRQAWEASKEVGPVLREGLLELRDLRNGVAREMGYDDFFTFQVSNYDMSREEMMALLDRLVLEIQPLYQELHCWVRHTLAERYGAEEVPERIPAHWVGNRWGQSWPGLVDGVELDTLVEGREPEWIVEQAERFYVSMGFPELPESFFERSDLYPVPEGDDRRKNAHASAWHMDLGTDVRSLMSVEVNWRWFETTHHELGHIYYYLAYARDEVPPLLRGGANRSFHEGVGELISLASAQVPYLRAIELLEEGETLDSDQVLLDSALTGPITFLPFAAGVMSHYEHDLYAEELPAAELNTRWWRYVGQYQGIAPPEPRDPEGCDAATKTHINDDPGQYYDYALATVLRYQLHDHICRTILEEDPHACNYYEREEVGAFLQGILSQGATRDWREVLREAVGGELSAAPMLEYYRPLLERLERENEGRSCGWPG